MKEVCVAVRLSAPKIARVLKAGHLNVTTRQVEDALDNNPKFVNELAKDMAFLWTEGGGDLSEVYGKFFPQGD